MHLNWNNALSRVLASSVVALMATTSLNAIPKGPCDTTPQVCCEEPKPGPFAFAYPMDMNIACPRDFYVHAEFIALQAKQDGMEWGMENGSGNAAPLTNGKVVDFSSDNDDWGYNYGARFGMGFYLDHDAWNVDFNWTWLNISQHDKENANTSGSLIIPLQYVGGSGSQKYIGQRSASKWDGSLNVLDVRLGKPYHVSRYLIVNPHFGVRAGWIDQQFSTDLSGLVGPGQTYSGNNRLILENTNNFWGFGARAGIDTDWVIGKGWCLFGNLSTSMLFGKFEVNQKSSYSADGATANIGYNLDDNHYMNVPNLEIMLGLGWGQHFNSNKYHLGLKAGYEFQVWWDQNNTRRFTAGAPVYSNDVVARGNLTFNGFSFRVALDL